MLFSLLEHYLNFHIIDTALKVSRSLYCFTASISHGVENYFPRLWGMSVGWVGGGWREKVCFSETIRCRKLTLGRDIGGRRCATSWCELDLTFPQ